MLVGMYCHVKGHSPCILKDIICSFGIPKYLPVLNVFAIALDCDRRKQAYKTFWIQSFSALRGGNVDAPLVAE